MKEESRVDGARLMNRNITRKERITILHDTELITIWFWLVSAGGLLTLLMMQLISAADHRSHVYHAAPAQLPQEAGDEQRAALVRTAHEPALTLVSTSWAWGIPHAVPDHRARDQDQAA